MCVGVRVCVRVCVCVLVCVYVCALERARVSLFVCMYAHERKDFI